MKRATAYGRLKVVRFLYTHIHMHCTPDSLVTAALNGQYDTFKWLFENTSVRLSSEWRNRKYFHHVEHEIIVCQALCTKVDCSLIEHQVDKMVQQADFVIIERLLSVVRKEIAFSAERSDNDCARLLAAIESMRELAMCRGLSLLQI